MGREAVFGEYRPGLVKDFQHQDTDTVDQRYNKDSFGGMIPVGININGEQHCIRQQGKRPDGGDHPVIMHKIIEKFPEGVGGKPGEIHDHKAEQGADQSKEQPEAEVIFC